MCPPMRNEADWALATMAAMKCRIEALELKLAKLEEIMRMQSKLTDLLVAEATGK